MRRRNFIGLSTLAVSLSRLCGTESGAKPLLSFGLLTDVQYADADPEGERHYRESIPKLKTAVEWLAGKKLPFTLHLGDLIDRDFKSFATVMPLFDGLGHPVRHLLGNHDYSVTDGEKGEVVRIAGMPRDYYQFSHSGVRFVMLDTNDVSTYKYLNGHNHAGAEAMRNGIPYLTFKSILHEPSVTAYSAIHLFADRLEIEGKGRESSRVIPLARI